MSQRLCRYLLPLLIFGCDQATLHEESDTVVTPPETIRAFHNRASLTANESLQVGTHQMGEEAYADFMSLEDGSHLPIVYGPQGAYMVILAVQLPHWAEAKVTISISTHFEGAVVASLFYPDLSVEKTDEGVYVGNLFMLTNNWESYTERPLLVEMRCLGQQTSRQTDLVLFFTPPQKSVF